MSYQQSTNGLTMRKTYGSGEGGIRTPGTREGTPVFETGTIGHSVTSPGLWQSYSAAAVVATRPL